jgi:protoporphyrinogen oxidase
VKTAILGAGVSGLALARALIEGGLDANDITLFEAAPVAGGLCRSKVIDGFTYDLAGGHILFSKKKEILDWMQTAGGGPEAFEERQRNTAIRFEDRWVRYPFENGIGDLPEQANYECLAGYVHAWHQRKLTGSEAPADFGAWIQWRFGEGIAKHFMDPYNEKIWKRPLQEITSEWVAGRVPDAPIEDVLRAAVGIRTEGYVHQSVFWYPKQGGFQAITDGMAADLQDRIRLSTPVDKITRQGEGWAVHGEEFDRVVLTTPLDLTPRLVEGVPQDVAKAMGELEYNGLVTYLVALDTPEQPDLSWCYLPHPNQGPANRVTWMSNYSEGGAPEGKSSLLVEITRPGREAQPDEDLEEKTLFGLENAGLIQRDQVLFTDRSDVDRAYVVYVHGHEKRRQKALGWLEDQGLFPLGRFGRFEYDNSDQCVEKARCLALRLLASHNPPT